MKTSSEDLTGNWRAEVNVGGTKFSKVVKVETIKPNRLKIEIDMEKGLNNGNMKGTLISRWLHGAKAKNLKARVEAQLDNSYLSIPKYEGFSFHDPSRSKFDKTPKVIFDKTLDENGEAKLEFKVEKSNLLPGRLKQKFRTRVFENGGNFVSQCHSIQHYEGEDTNERLITYQTSYSNFCCHEIAFLPFTCALPVIPGFTKCLFLCSSL